MYAHMTVVKSSPYGLDECYCGSFLASSAVLESDTDCNMPCAGDATELCGAGCTYSPSPLHYRVLLRPV